jgi:hypothetical protein
MGWRGGTRSCGPGGGHDGGLDCGGAPVGVKGLEEAREAIVVRVVVKEDTGLREERGHERRWLRLQRSALHGDVGCCKPARQFDVEKDLTNRKKGKKKWPIQVSNL